MPCSVGVDCKAISMLECFELGESSAGEEARNSWSG